MPNGNTPQPESVSPTSSPYNVERKIFAGYDDRETAGLLKLYEDGNKEEIKRRFKEDIRKQLDQGKIITDPGFANKNSTTAKKLTELVKEAFAEINLEKQSEEWSKDPANLIVIEENVNNVAKAADPIDLFSGNFVYSNVDIVVAGAGMDFAFKRTHTNQSIYSGPLGEKWDHSYNLRLRVAADYNIIYRSNGSGAEIMYRRHEIHNYWLSEKGEDGIITQLGNRFVWRSSDGIELNYDSQTTTSADIFLIKKISDRFGNYLEFDYDTYNRLSHAYVNHPERKVTFIYDGDDIKIREVLDFFDRRWTYTYDDFGDLVAITTPAPEKFGKGFTTIYEYSTALVTDKPLQHNIISIIDANGQIYLENEYGTTPILVSYNKVTRQRQGGGETLLDYEDIVEDFNFYYESNQRPSFQTTVIGRDGHSLRYLFNKFGNMLFKEEYFRVNGIPKIISSHYRYNRDGNLIGTISPEGKITQFLYGRDFYERNKVINEDYLDIEDSSLTSKERQNFNRLLASIQRADKKSLNLSDGLWSDIFPDIYKASPEDIIQKFTYELEYGQPLTISDPRYTESADPNYLESHAYELHLRRYHYRKKSQGDLSSPFHLLDRVELPSATSPDGINSGPTVFKMELYDKRGRLNKSVGPEGLVTLVNYYDETLFDGLLEGFPKETILDPNQLYIKTAVDRDELGRVINNYSPKFFDNTGNKFIVTTEYNRLSQIVTVTNTYPFKFKLRRQYNRVGKIKLESMERKKADGNSYEEQFGIKRYYYDEEFNLLKSTVGGAKNTDHKQYRNVYDMNGRLFLVISPAGRKTKLYYNEHSLVAKRVYDHGGVRATTKMYHDGDGRLIREINATGAETKYFYNLLGKLIESQDSLGNKRLLTYDKIGNILIERYFEKSEQGYRLMSRSEYMYDELGRLSIASANQFESANEVSESSVGTAFVDNGPGDLLSIKYFYDKNGQVTKTVDTSGRETRMEYDKIGRLIKNTDPYGNDNKFLYDKHGNITRSDSIEVTRHPITNAIVVRNYFSSTFAYDEMDRLVNLTDSLGNQAHYEYDSLSQTTKLTDSLANTTENDYDIFGRNIQVRKTLLSSDITNLPVLVRTLYRYDQDDLLIEQIDPLGRVTEFRYDSMGRLVSTILPDNSQDESTYNYSNQINKYHDRNGIIYKHEYDILGRLTTTKIEDTNLIPGVHLEGSRIQNYRYDALGRIIYMENEFCKNSLTYNSLGWLLEENNVYSSPGNPNDQMQFAIKRGYNNSGELSSIIYPSGREIRYKRDILGRITSIKQETKGLDYPGDSSIAESFVIMDVEYEGMRRKRIRRHNQTVTEFNYDRGGKMIEIKHLFKDDLLMHHQYLYDAMGNVRQKNEASIELNRTTNFQYDSLYRISSTFNFEVNSIRHLESLSPFTDPVPDLIPDSQSEINSFIRNDLQLKSRYAYDLVGNRLTKEKENEQLEQYFMYNNLDQYSLVNDNKMIYDMTGNLIEDKKWKFGYNANNQLSSIQSKDQNNNQIIKFYHDAMGRKILEMRNNQSTLFVNDGPNVIEEYIDNEIHSSIVSDVGIDNIIEVSTNNTNFWTYADIIKSIIYTMKGEEKNQYYDYDEFGKIMTPINDGIFLSRFAGKRFIPAAEKYDFLLRTYDPQIGRFLQRDPKGYVDGTNLYTYALNNPTSRTDPFGTETRQATINEVTNLPIYKELKNYDEMGKRASKYTNLIYLKMKPIEEFYDEVEKEYRQHPPLRAWWAGWSDEDLQPIHELNPEYMKQYYDLAKSAYINYLEDVDWKLEEGFRRMDIAADFVNKMTYLMLKAATKFTGPASPYLGMALDAALASNSDDPMALLDITRGAMSMGASLGQNPFSLGRSSQPSQSRLGNAGGGGVGRTGGGGGGNQYPTLTFDYNNPNQRQIADNVWNAQKAGHPSILTHGGNTTLNRRLALEGIPNYFRGIRFERDEYPFASSMEGGAGSWIGHPEVPQNSSQGGSMGPFLKGIQPGQQYRVMVINHPGGPSP